MVEKKNGNKKKTEKKQEKQTEGSHIHKNGITFVKDFQLCEARIGNIEGWETDIFGKWLIYTQTIFKNAYCVCVVRVWVRELIRVWCAKHCDFST